MSKTINILGESQQEQWKSAIFMMSIAIESNIVYVRERLCDEELIEHLDKSAELLGLFRGEMNRLVEGVFE